MNLIDCGPYILNLIDSLVTYNHYRLSPLGTLILCLGCWLIFTLWLASILLSSGYGTFFLGV